MVVPNTSEQPVSVVRYSNQSRLKICNMYRTLLKYTFNVAHMYWTFYIFIMRDKRSKFIELANNRVNRAIRDLRLIGNLSNRAAYEYKDEDVRQIVRTLQQELETLRARFGRSGGKPESEFQLKP